MNATARATQPFQTACFGILGGMGPMAGVNLLNRITGRTPARIDQEHLPIVLYSLPQIPDRSSAIVDNAASPLPFLERGIKFLSAAGASEIAIACNTAHHWHRDLQQVTGARVLHVVDAVIAELGRRGQRGETVGLLATLGTIRSGFYQHSLTNHGYRFVTVDGDLQTKVAQSVALIKGNRLAEAESLLQIAAQELRCAGADVIVLACSEIGLVLQDTEAVPCLDSMDALASYIVDRWSKHVHMEPNLCHRL